MPNDPSVVSTGSCAGSCPAPVLATLKDGLLHIGNAAAGDGLVIDPAAVAGFSQATKSDVMQILLKAGGSIPIRNGTLAKQALATWTTWYTQRVAAGAKATK